MRVLLKEPKTMGELGESHTKVPSGPVPMESLSRENNVSVGGMLGSRVHTGERRPQPTPLAAIGCTMPRASNPTHPREATGE